MPLDYDIFKKTDDELIWVESAHDFYSAKKRIKELAEQNHTEYVVYDQGRKRIVASFDNQLGMRE